MTSEIGKTKLCVYRVRRSDLFTEEAYYYRTVQNASAWKAKADCSLFIGVVCFHDATMRFVTATAELYALY